MKKGGNALALIGFIVSMCAVPFLVMAVLCFVHVLANEATAAALCVGAQTCAATGAALSAVGLDRAVNGGLSGHSWAIAGLCGGVAAFAMAAAWMVRF